MQHKLRRKKETPVLKRLQRKLKRSQRSRASFKKSPRPKLKTKRRKFRSQQNLLNKNSK